MPNLKNKIKAQAIRLFYEKGYFACGMSEIAEAVGIQKSSIYYHFPGKESILFDIFKTTLTDLLQAFKHRVPADGPAPERVRAAVRLHVIFHIQRKKECMIADSEMKGLSPKNREAVAALRDEYTREFLSILVQGKKKGDFCMPDVKVAGFAILTMCTAAAVWFKENGRLSASRVADLYAHLALNGLGCGREPETP